MAKWRDYELEAIFGGPLDAAGITDASVGAMVNRGQVEGAQLDFKSKVPLLPPKSSQGGPVVPEFAKDVAAFANHRGGVLLFGIAEVEKAASEIVGLADLNLEAAERDLRGMLLNYVAPQVEVDVVEIPVGDVKCLAVVVPRSPRAPHAVFDRSNHQRRPMVYPVRDGADTRYMSEPEIAERYRQRSVAAASHTEQVRALVADGRDYLQRELDGTVWLYLGVIPERPVEVEMNEDQKVMAERWLRDTAATAPLHQSAVQLPLVIPGPGRTTFTGYASADTFAEASDQYIELHTNGCAFVAMDAQRRQPVERRQTSHGVDLLDLVDFMIWSTEVGIRWAADQTGGWGSATLVVGITDSSKMFRNLELQQSSYHLFGKVSSSRVVRREPESIASIDLARVGTRTERLVGAYRAAAGLLQWFGLAEPAQLNSRGQLRVDRWLTPQDTQMAQQWVQTQGLDIGPATPGDG